jgi:hypothetical protein
MNYFTPTIYRKRLLELLGGWTGNGRREGGFGLKSRIGGVDGVLMWAWLDVRERRGWEFEWDALSVYRELWKSDYYRSEIIIENAWVREDGEGFMV